MEAIIETIYGVIFRSPDFRTQADRTKLIMPVAEKNEVSICFSLVSPVIPISESSLKSSYSLYATRPYTIPTEARITANEYTVIL